MIPKLTRTGQSNTDVGVLRKSLWRREERKLKRSVDGFLKKKQAIVSFILAFHRDPQLSVTRDLVFPRIDEKKSTNLLPDADDKEKIS